MAVDFRAPGEDLGGDVVGIESVDLVAVIAHQAEDPFTEVEQRGVSVGGKDSVGLQKLFETGLAAVGGKIIMDLSWIKTADDTDEGGGLCVAVRTAHFKGTAGQSGKIPVAGAVDISFGTPGFCTGFGLCDDVGDEISRHRRTGDKGPVTDPDTCCFQKFFKKQTEFFRGAGK